MQQHTFIVSYSTKCAPHVTRIRTVKLFADFVDPDVQLAAIDIALRYVRGSAEVARVEHMLL